MNWSHLRYFGNSKFVKGNYIWIILVPVVAKFLISANNNITIFDTEFELKLPFNWIILYFSSLFFSIAHSIYLLRCPTIIKDNGDYGDYIKSGFGITKLNQYIDFFSKYDLLINNNLKPNKLSQLLSDKLNDIAINTSSNDIDKKITMLVSLPKINDSYNIKNDYEKLVFWEIFNASETINTISKYASVFSYGVGIALLSIIFIQNILFVLHSL